MLKVIGIYIGKAKNYSIQKIIIKNEVKKNVKK